MVSGDAVAETWGPGAGGDTDRWYRLEGGKGCRELGSIRKYV